MVFADGKYQGIHIVLRDDIASAVEWLKQEMYKLFNTEKSLDFDNWIPIIDQAFEDAKEVKG
jgi:hypothetical protein